MTICCGFGFDLFLFPFLKVISQSRAWECERQSSKQAVKVRSNIFIMFIYLEFKVESCTLKDLFILF